MFTRTSLLIGLVFIPLTASSQVVFTEVMYDLETGSDSGREWVEIQNTGSATVDVSGYRFREGTTNHTLILSSGNATLSAGGVAIIADNPSKFLLDNPSFSGTLFDSSFSLGNTGETLVLKDSALVDLDSFTYSSDMGGAGDGKTLHRSGSSWVAALPTPGSVAGSSSTPLASGAGSSSASSSATSESATSSTSSTSLTTESPGTVSGSSSKWPVKSQIYSYAGEDKRVTVGTPEEFEGEALGIDKKPLQNARYLWNFGDGAYGEGKHLLHTYHYPGAYAVTLDVSAGEFSNSDKLVVTVTTADLILRRGQDTLGGYLEIENRTGEETNLSYWQLVSSGRMYALPKDTLLLSRRSVRFPESVTGLSYSLEAELRYPNGTRAVSSSPQISTEFPKVASPVAVATVVSKSLEKPSSRVAARTAPAISAEALTASVASLSPQPATSSTAANLTDYKWFYALAALIGFSLVGIVWMGRVSREDIEIIEDPS